MPESWQQRVARWLLPIWLAAPGCASFTRTPDPSLTVETGHYDRLARRVEFPDSHDGERIDLVATESPRSLRTAEAEQYFDLSLEQAIQLGLQHSRVLRDLGGFVLRSPESVRTSSDPAIVETDPRLGLHAALSAFDASFRTSTSYEYNDRALNNVFFGGGTRLLQQNFLVNQAQLSKTTATGTQVALKSYTQYDANNAPGNFVPSAWTTWYDVEARHPLLQGGGINFNRLAGPSAVPGGLNGVVIARINSDVSLAEFEISVRNYLSDIENGYWDLYFAYRDLEAKVAARDAALETWRRIQALYEQGRRGGEAEKEAQAREQYFRFEEEAQNALQGKLVDGTRTHNGSAGGTFRGSGGVYVTERRLRLLIGLPISDGQLLRPLDEPSPAPVIYDWPVSLTEALTERPELRRQKWLIKKREAELAAHKNFLLPQLDLLARYRWRGFGDTLLPDGGVGGRFDNAYRDLLSGDFQEWQAGVEFSLPIGFRRAYAAVRQSELQLVRERAILQEQERSVVHDLSNAVAEVDRAATTLETNRLRRLAAMEQVQAVQVAFESDAVPLDLLLEAQRRLADAHTSYHRALVEYALACKNVQWEKGTLLAHNQVLMQEGPHPDEAYDDAALREYLQGEPMHRSDAPLTPAPTVSTGPVRP
jgi:hypothetical protein